MLVGVAGWAALAALWLWQLGLGVPARWVEGPVLVLFVFGLWVGFLLCWIVWSRSIYRRRHRRTTPVRYEVGFAADSLGRRITAEPGTVAASRVEISVSGAWCEGV